MTRLTPRDISLQPFPTRVNGYDRTAVRNFLNDAAHALETALRERDALREEAEQAALAQASAPLQGPPVPALASVAQPAPLAQPVPVPKPPPGLDLPALQAAAQSILAEAEARAAQIVQAAEAHAADLMARSGARQAADHAQERAQQEQFRQFRQAELEEGYRQREAELEHRLASRRAAAETEWQRQQQAREQAWRAATERERAALEAAQAERLQAMEQQYQVKHAELSQRLSAVRREYTQFVSGYHTLLRTYADLGSRFNLPEDSSLGWRPLEAQREPGAGGSAPVPGPFAPAGLPPGGGLAPASGTGLGARVLVSPAPAGSAGEGPPAPLRPGPGAAPAYPPPGGFGLPFPERGHAAAPEPAPGPRPVRVERLTVGVPRPGAGGVSPLHSAYPPTDAELLDTDGPYTEGARPVGRHIADREPELPPLPSIGVISDAALVEGIEVEPPQFPRRRRST